MYNKLGAFQGVGVRAAGLWNNGLFGGGCSRRSRSCSRSRSHHGILAAILSCLC